MCLLKFVTPYTYMCVYVIYAVRSLGYGDNNRVRGVTTIIDICCSFIVGCSVNSPRVDKYQKNC